MSLNNGNGATIRLPVALAGIIVTLLLQALGFFYTYGQINAKVDALQQDNIRLESRIEAQNDLLIQFITQRQAP